MPIYEFQHPKTGEVFEVLRPMSKSNDPFYAPDGVKCKKVISMPGTAIIKDAPDRYERKEAYHRSKVKDKDRAMRNRKKHFGAENVSVTKSEFAGRSNKIQKKVVPQGEGKSSEIDKTEFIKAAARNPNAVSAAKKVLGK